MKTQPTTAPWTAKPRTRAEGARQLAGAAALTAVSTMLGTELVFLLAIGAALAFPVLPVAAVLLMRTRAAT